MKSTTQIEKIPDNLQAWRILRSQLPPVRIAGFDVSFIFASTAVLTAIRYVVEYMLIEAFGWPENNMITKSAASSLTSIVHSMNLVPSLGICFLNHKYNPSESISEAPKWWQETSATLIHFCTGYMIYDGLVNILWTKGMNMESDDKIFLFHHFITSFYMISTQVYGAGHQSAMMCMFLGEFTNPLHNCFYFAEAAQKLDCCNGAISTMFLAVVRFSFSLLYIVVRGLISPFILGHVSWHVVFRRNSKVPLWLVIIWAFLIWVVLIGSIPWITECWSKLLQYVPESASSSDL